VTLITTVYVREGIVMASDSRLSLTVDQKQDNGQVLKVTVPQSDSSYKTFLTQTRIGISTFGAADIEGVPVAGFIESFISEQVADKLTEVEAVTRKLLGHFRKFHPDRDIQFYVAGYSRSKGKADQQIWHVYTLQNKVERLNHPGKQGAIWGGETDILARLINHVGALDTSGKLTNAMPYFQIQWQYFTLQDAIDFSIYAIRSTIDSFRFQTRPKTVGGPIDVLVIKPDEAFWVQRKELHA
jgi:hypothetical protein